MGCSKVVLDGLERVHEVFCQRALVVRLRELRLEPFGLHRTVAQVSRFEAMITTCPKKR